MGFMDAVGGFFQDVGRGIGSFVQSDPFREFATDLAGFGAAKLADVIGIRPTTTAGSPGGRYMPGISGPAYPTYGRPTSMTLPRPSTAAPPSWRPINPSLAAVPSSSPYGAMPGAERATPGGTMAFPVDRYQGFPVQPASFTALAPLAGMAVRALPGLAAGMAGGEFADWLQGANAQADARAVAVSPGGGTPMFRPTMAGYRAQTFRAQNPVTGQDVYFKPAGRPILWSSDLSACKRVKKVARRAARKR